MGKTDPFPIRTGAQFIVDFLKAQGVNIIFGYPGAAIVPILNVLYDDADMQFILTRHEQAAAHAADGFSRATGRIGVCLATSGPGATNLTTGIATAYKDSIPMIAITGQVHSTMLGRDAFQEVDMVGISRPITKWSTLVEHPSEIALAMASAFYYTKSSRPGPVLIDITKDAQSENVRQGGFEEGYALERRDKNPKEEEMFYLGG